MLCNYLLFSLFQSESQWSASGPSSSSTTPAESQDCLWELFDNRVRESHTTHCATADATVEVKKVPHRCISTQNGRSPKVLEGESSNFS